MQLTIDIPEKDLVEFGRESIEQEIESMLKWLRIKQNLKRISKGLKDIDDKTYFDTIDKIKEDAWHEYKKDLNL